MLLELQSQPFCSIRFHLPFSNLLQPKSETHFVRRKRMHVVDERRFIQGFYHRQIGILWEPTRNITMLLPTSIRNSSGTQPFPRSKQESGINNFNRAGSRECVVLYTLHEGISIFFRNTSFYLYKPLVFQYSNSCSMWYQGLFK